MKNDLLTTEEVADELKISVESARKWLTIQQLADRWRVSDDAIRRQVHSGDLKSRKVGGVMVVTLRSIAEREAPACNQTVREVMEMLSRPARPIVDHFVYFLFDGDAIVYIGQSVNPSRRVYSHSDKAFDRYETIKIRRQDCVDVVERALIGLFKPPLNRRHVDADPRRFAQTLKQYGFAVSVNR